MSKPHSRKSASKADASLPTADTAIAYPREPLEDAVKIPFSIKACYGGNPCVPRELARAMGLSKAMSRFAAVTAAAEDFGFTEGRADSARISLTPQGRDLVFAPTTQVENDIKQRAFLSIDVFRKVLEYYKGNALPEMQYLKNTLQREFKLRPGTHAEFSRLFKQNCDYLNIGEGFATTNVETDDGDGGQITIAEPTRATGLRCFVIMPFREAPATGRPAGFFNEVQTKLLAPAGSEAGFTVTTGRREGTELIHSTIVNELLDADLVLADLTDHNPNVLFELGMRMALDKPVVLVKAKGTTRLFDVEPLRVLEYDPNLWPSTLADDLPELVKHIASTWKNKDQERTYLQLFGRRLTGRLSWIDRSLPDLSGSGAIGKLLDQYDEMLSKAIEPVEQGFKLSHPGLAIYSYMHFWDLLLDEMEAGKKRLTVEAIHSCEMDIWSGHSLTNKLIDVQRRFHQAGGSITRVLCGQGKKPKQAFVDAYKKMAKANINVRYYDFDEGVINHDFSWDFLRVRETGAAVIWASLYRGGGGVIGEAIYTTSPRYGRKHLANLWKDIVEHSQPFPTNA
jgi:hypothetical protein